MFHAKHSLPLSQTKFCPQIGTSHLCNFTTTSITFVNPSLLRYDRFVSRGSLAPGGPPLPYHVHEASSPSGEEPSKPESPFPSLSQLLYLDSWKGLVIGVFLSLILPFWGSRLGPLLKIKNEAETAVEVADIAAEITEFVAEKVEDAADKLPEGGKFKGVATSIEMAAKVTAKDAQLAQEFLDKVKKVEKEVDSFLGEEEEDPIESAIEKAEEVTEVVEKVAEGVEKAAEEVPDGGKLKAAATFVENAAEETAKDAHRVEEVIERAEEAKEEVETVIFGSAKLERIIRAIKRR